MNSTATVDFLVNREVNNIIIRREFAAEISLVWDAFTKSEILDQWWGPKPWNAKTKSMDFREGGRWHYAMAGPGGEVHWALVIYRKIRVHKSFSGLDAFADIDGNVNKDLPQSNWEITFSPRGQATLVEFHISFDDPAHLDAMINMGFREGLTTAMEGLDELLPSLKK